MRQRLFPLIIMMVILLLPVSTAVQAQGGADGWTTRGLNLRSGPGTTFDILTTLPEGSGLVFEARSEDASWLLGHTEDGAWRGWITAQYLRYREGFSVEGLAVSAEQIGQPGPAAAGDSPAPGGAAAWTDYTLNVRAGPGTTYRVVGRLAANTPLVPEARSADTSWLLVHTADGAQRGWVSALYLHYAPGFVAASLPTSDEMLAAASPAAGSLAPPAVSYSSAAEALMAVPVVPTISGHAREIFQGSGNNAQSLIKIGDCNSEYWEFLGPFGNGSYDLGAYGYLQPTVDFFRDVWSTTHITAHGGYNILAVLDPLWASYAPQCNWGETPLDCELRTRRPAVAVMMFGPNDVAHLSAQQYESALRQVVETTIANGTIPVLTTFTWCQTGDYHEKGLQFNLITVNVAREYDVPLINFWRAAQGLPHCGLLDDTHLSKPVMTTTAYFNGEEQRTGHTLRNLLTLQTLDAIRTSALQ